MTVRSKSNLLSYISGILPDNNAGMISAADVRNSIVDTAESIETIVANGSFNSTPFVNDVRLQMANGAGGTLYVGSGIEFPGGARQYVPYPGPNGISHNTLTGLDAGDPHQQYLVSSGTRPMTGSLGMRNNWINSSGSADVTSNNGYRGLQFNYVNPTGENVNIGSGTSLVFLRDRSRINSARGVAKAWINFDGSGTTPVVRDSYNVSGIQKLGDGKFKIIFHSGVFKDNNYVAIGTSNAMVGANSAEDFTNNTVGIVTREGNDGTSLRSLVYVIRDEGNRYINAKINDLVVYGTEMLGSGQPPVTILT